MPGDNSIRIESKWTNEESFNGYMKLAKCEMGPFSKPKLLFFQELERKLDFRSYDLLHHRRPVVVSLGRFETLVPLSSADQKIKLFGRVTHRSPFCDSGS